MSHSKDYKKESQDARRRDEHNKVHPSEKTDKNVEHSSQNPAKDSNSTPNKRK